MQIRSMNSSAETLTCTIEPCLQGLMLLFPQLTIPSTPISQLLHHTRSFRLWAPNYIVCSSTCNTLPHLASLPLSLGASSWDRPHLSIPSRQHPQLLVPIPTPWITFKALTTIFTCFLVAKMSPPTKMSAPQAQRSLTVLSPVLAGKRQLLWILCLL